MLIKGMADNIMTVYVRAMGQIAKIAPSGARQLSTDIGESVGCNSRRGAHAMLMLTVRNDVRP